MVMPPTVDESGVTQLPMFVPMLSPKGLARWAASDPRGPARQRESKLEMARTLLN